jgi:hypothetical protein
MRIALDFDGTFDQDVEGWTLFTDMMHKRGHTIVGVTMRYPHETVGEMQAFHAACDKVYYTSRKAKQPFLAERGILINVWIDDNPHWVNNDAR